ncbi:MAG TPA: LLM class flavin-dependent oxidoreductase [Candidatus Limnocylindrales bacterium]|nr:LLM class flavin-dependent oxidoreductase [Candidatus Limnocylindrales bacterium]
MQYGVIITGGDALEQVQLAREAEAAGWDGVFTWDGIHVADDIETYDPWALLAAFASVTSRVTLGAIISPLSRRRPWKVARETTTVDRLSNGRLVLPVGLGAKDDRAISGITRPPEAATSRERAELLDETLHILEGLWRGEPFAFDGEHYAFDAMAFRPTPIQRPRIPIWVVGAWPSDRSMERVVRYDGWLPYWLPRKDTTEGLARPEEPQQLREAIDWIAERRSLDGFDIVMEGTTPADDPVAARTTVDGWADAGATWWIESDWNTFDVGAQRRRVAAGPPRPSP